MLPDGVSGVIRELHAETRVNLYLVIGGAGTRLVSWLFQAPGASKTVLGIEVPYSRQAMDAFLDADVSEYVSLSTAELLSKAAYKKARGLLGSEHQRQIVGISCTGNIKSDGSRSQNKVFTACFDGERGVSYALPLHRTEASRDMQELASSALLLNTTLEAAGVPSRIQLPLEYGAYVSQTHFGAP